MYSRIEEASRIVEKVFFLGLRYEPPLILPPALQQRVDSGLLIDLPVASDNVFVGEVRHGAESVYDNRTRPGNECQFRHWNGPGCLFNRSAHCAGVTNLSPQGKGCRPHTLFSNRISRGITILADGLSETCLQDCITDRTSPFKATLATSQPLRRQQPLPGSSFHWQRADGPHSRRRR